MRTDTTPPGAVLGAAFETSRAAREASEASACDRPVPESLAAKRAFLESGAAWPGSPPPDCIETHASLVFLTRDRAWKLKKPVRLPKLDFRTLAARAHFCREELRLNRELAGPVYVGLVPLLLQADGSLSLGGEGRVVDWLVEMRRLPAEEMLDARLRSGPPPCAEEIDAVCDRMIRFYCMRPRVAGAGARYARRLEREARTNATHLREMRATLGDKLDESVLEAASEGLARSRPEILARGARGLVVEGHGDLRPDHVCLTRPPVVFDRVEFDHDFRLIDPHDEIEALGLDCAHAGAGWIRPALHARLAGAGLPPPSPALLRAWGATRCLTRARLSIDHLRDAEVRTPEKWPVQARDYLAQAAAVLAGG